MHLRLVKHDALISVCILLVFVFLSISGEDRMVVQAGFVTSTTVTDLEAHVNRVVRDRSKLAA